MGEENKKSSIFNEMQDDIYASNLPEKEKQKILKN